MDAFSILHPVLSIRASASPFERSSIMAHIQLPIAEALGREFPGILGPMTFRPETAAPLNQLVNTLLRGESTLSRGERELIATHVSWRNDCFFCQTIHGAVAAAQLGHDEALVQKVKTDWVACSPASFSIASSDLAFRKSCF
jgi:AhpD family alkylhydroperoxidase